MQNIYLNGVDIRVSTFDLTLTDFSIEYKLDLLYYNNINRYGEILSSLVYNSNVRLALDTDTILYNPNKLFLNNSFERSYILEGSSNRWKNADLLTDGLSNLNDNSASAVYPYKKFDVNLDYAPAYQNGIYTYDGWYTLYSVALIEYPDEFIPTVEQPILYQGTMRYYDGRAQYAIQDNPTELAHWRDLNDIDTTIDIYNFIREDRYDPYSSLDFMVTTKIHSLYKKLLDNKLDNNWFKKLNILSPKLRTLHTAVEFKNFDKAQHIINSVDNSLLTLLI